jgi:adenine-specific DNA-methyltransferase
VIKYLGSKRLLIPQILDAVRRGGGGACESPAPCPCAPSVLGKIPTVLDLFSGTSRVGHALKRAGYRVVANDHAAYAATLARCYVQADAEDVLDDARRLVAEFNALPGTPGYVTETFCTRARYFHPRNGERIDAIRAAIARKGLEPELEAVVLTSLIEAADRVDSTTGVQMAYLKEWAPRALRDMELRVPEVLPRAAGGKGAAYCLDALEAADRLEADVAYIDPPYNQHAYLGNYHVWETIARGDEPPTFGVACKREDVRTRRSVFNSRRRHGAALADLLARVRARVLVVSCSSEGFVTRERLEGLLAGRWGGRARVETIAVEYPRYVGAKIGIHNPKGEKVGVVGALTNTEYVCIATREDVPAIVGAV